MQRGLLEVLAVALPVGVAVHPMADVVAMVEIKTVVCLVLVVALVVQ